MKSCLGDVQKAVYGILKGDGTLTGMITGVFDGAPQNQAFPYITIGEQTAIPFRAHDTSGEETTITVHIWSKNENWGPGSYKEALLVLDEVNRLLGDKGITVPGYNVVWSFYEFSQAMVADDEVRHVAAQYRIILQEV
jgi:hypothetical protein